jgi:hypothetical protein
MQTSRPDPDNPWPHDMTIVVEDSPFPLLDLLFVRHLWSLDVPEVPPLEDSEGLVRRAVPFPGIPAAEFERQWLQEWNRAFSGFEERHRIPARPDQAMLDEITNTPDAELDQRFGYQLPGLLRDDYVDEFNRWKLSVVDPREGPWDESPEWQSIPALIGAWRRGLTTIVQLPFQGPYARSLNREHLVVSRETRADPALFTRALEEH